MHTPSTTAVDRKIQLLYEQRANYTRLVAPDPRVLRLFSAEIARLEAERERLRASKPALPLTERG